MSMTIRDFWKWLSDRLMDLGYQELAEVFTNIQEIIDLLGTNIDFTEDVDLNEFSNTIEGLMVLMSYCGMPRGCFSCPLYIGHYCVKYYVRGYIIESYDVDMAKYKTLYCKFWKTSTVPEKYMYIDIESIKTHLSKILAELMMS